MKRQSLLIAACCLAAVSLGGNIWLLMHRKDKPVAPGPATQTTPHDASIGPVLQPVTMDFSDTAFADGSWKLTDETDPSISIDGKPFSWDDVKPEKLKIEVPARPPFGPLRFGLDMSIPKPVEHVPYDIAEPSSAESWHPPWKTRGESFNVREVPGYLDMALPDPNNVRNKALLATPPFSPK